MTTLSKSKSQLHLPTFTIPNGKPGRAVLLGGLAWSDTRNSVIMPLEEAIALRSYFASGDGWSGTYVISGRDIRVFPIPQYAADIWTLTYET